MNLFYYFIALRIFIVDLELHHLIFLRIMLYVSSN